MRFTHYSVQYITDNFFLCRPKDAVKAVRKRLSQNMGKNHTAVLYTLTVSSIQSSFLLLAGVPLTSEFQGSFGLLPSLSY